MKTAKLFACSLLAVTMFAACEEDPGQDKVLYTVTVTSDENGTATASAPEAEAGAEVTLTAVPAEGYIFDKWTVVEGSVTIAAEDVTKESIVITMPAEDISVSASFIEEKVPHAINVTAPENGTIAVTNDLAEAISGETVEVTASPAEGYDFVKWTVSGVDIAEEDLTSNPLSFVMPDAEVTVSAEFEEIFDVIAAIPDDEWSEVWKAFLNEHKDHAISVMNPLTGETELSPAWDTNGDGILSDKEAAQVKIINLNGGFTSQYSKDEYDNPLYEEAGALTLAGIEYFTGLEVLDCGYGYNGKSGGGEDLDLSALHNLKYLDLCDAYSLEYSNFTLCDAPGLVHLDLGGTWISELDLSKYPELTYLSVEHAYLEELDLSTCPKLTYIGLYQSDITELDITCLETSEPMLTFSSSKTYTITLRADQKAAVEAIKPSKIEDGTLILIVVD